MTAANVCVFLEHADLSSRIGQLELEEFCVMKASATK
jgi:hypothetical protein